MTQQVKCISCSSVGYSDERTWVGDGYMCSKCTHPHINRGQEKNKKEEDTNG
jgi:hypothetical protein